MAPLILCSPIHLQRNYAFHKQMGFNFYTSWAFSFTRIDSLNTSLFLAWLWKWVKR